MDDQALSKTNIAVPAVSLEVGKEKNISSLLIGLLAILVVIIGFQAVQLSTLTKLAKAGGIGVSASQGSNSLLQGLKAQVGGCGG